MRYALLLFFYSTLGLASSSLPVIGVIGDHYSLGVWADPDLNYGSKDVWTRLSSSEPQTARTLPKVLGFTEREFSSPEQWLGRQTEETFLNRALVSPEKSWSMQLATQVGVPGGQVFLALGHHTSIEDLPRQADRLLKESRGFLPKHLFVFYPIADLCAPSTQGVTSPALYGESLDRGLRYLIQNSVPNPEGTIIYLVSPPNLPFELTKPEILAKSVLAFGTQTTCGALRQSGFVPPAQGQRDAGQDLNTALLEQFLSVSPAGQCPILFAPVGAAQRELGFFDWFKSESARDRTIKSTMRDQLSYLSSTVRATRKAIKDSERKMSSWLSAKNKTLIKVHLITVLEGLQLQPEWVANDCFHLSEVGYQQIAERFKAELQP